MSANRRSRVLFWIIVSFLLIILVLGITALVTYGPKWVNQKASQISQATQTALQHQELEDKTQDLEKENQQLQTQLEELTINCQKTQPEECQPASVATSNCQVKVISNFKFEVKNNQDDGDPYNWTVVTAWDGENQDSRFIAVIEPMFSLDFESELIQGRSIKVEGKQKDVICYAESLDIEGYQLYVGDLKTPPGWSKDFPESWEMHTWVYSEKPISPSGDWKPIKVSLADNTHSFTATDGYMYLQLWDGYNADLGWDIIIAPGWTLTTPPLQGSGGTFINTSNIKMVIARYKQSSFEREQRDQLDLTRFYCGPDDLQPEGWSKDLPDNWNCTKSQTNS